MSNREKILAAAVAVLLVGWGAREGWQRYQDALSKRRNDVIDAREKLNATKLAQARGLAAMANLDRWQQRSLPSNPQQANALYRTWLLERLRDARLPEDGLTIVPPSRRSNAYQTVGYQIETKGELAAVSRFLYDFYHHDHMHKIVQLQLRPEAGSSNVNVNMRVEGIIVDGAVRADALSDGLSDRLALDGADEYRESIASRNIFQVYNPRGAESAPQQDGVDRAAETFVTHIQTGKNPQVWLRINSTGRLYYLGEGDRIRIPGFFAQVDEIRQREVVVSRGDEVFEIGLGKNLRQGRALKTDDGNRRGRSNARRRSSNDESETEKGEPQTNDSEPKTSDDA